MTVNTKKSKRMRRRVITLVVLLALCFFGWFCLNSIAKGKVEAQLAAAGLSDADIDSVRVGFNGVSITGLKLKAAPGIDVFIPRIDIRQPVLKLAQGITPFESIEVVDAKFSIDSRKIEGGSNFSLSDLDLEAIQLPSNRLKLADAEFKFFDADGTIEAQKINLNLSHGSGTFEIDGAMDTLESKVSVSGRVFKKSTKLDIKFSGQQLHLVDKQWQKWPGIGAATRKHLGADTVFDLSGHVGGSLKDGISYLADVKTKNARIYIPKFDLPIQIRSADVEIADGLVTYKSVVAAMGDGDIVKGTGTTSIDGLPCRSKFEGDFTNVDVADLRKLVKQIPLKVSGTATGHVVGSVDVNEALETTLRISANGDTNQASYGTIQASSGKLDVQIQPLLLRKDGKMLDLQGAVTVDAKTTDQNVDDILKTFDLESLDQQFEFDMVGTGEVELEIPLDTAGDLRTWKLEIESKSDSGSVGGLALSNLDLSARLKNGNLLFQPTNAQLAANPNSQVSVFVEWPLPNSAAENISDVGNVEVSGVNIPPKDSLKFFDRQMKNANVDYRLRPQVISLAESTISGNLNFESRISLPATGERSIELWEVEAKVLPSKLSYAGVDLDSVTTELTIERGILELGQLQGKAAGGGTIEAALAVDLTSGNAKDIRVDARRFPATWLAETIVRIDSSGEFSNRTGLSSENIPQEVKGVFNANIEMHANESGAIAWNLTSDELLLYGKPFKNLMSSGAYVDELAIQKISSKLPGRGDATLVGDWRITSDDGSFEIQWKDADLASLLERRFKLPESFAAYSTGKVEACFRSHLPVFTGRVELIEPQILGGTLANQSFEIDTVDGRIHFKTGEKNGEVAGLQLGGQLGLQHPFQFSVDGVARSMPLSTAVFDEVTGRVNSDFSVTGQAEPWVVKSKGNAKFENLSYRKSSLSDVTSTWDFDTALPNSQSLKIDGFGGTLSLVSSESVVDRDLTFVANEINAAELSVFRTLPIDVTGTISGSATIRDWQSSSARSVVAKVGSDSLSVGSLRLARVNGQAKLSSGGQLEYSLDSQLLDGKLQCTGSTELTSIANVSQNKFPLNVRLDNARLKTLAQPLSGKAAELLRQLDGQVSLAMDWNVLPGKFPKGSGKISLNDTKWKNRLVSRSISSDVFLTDGIMRLENFNADLRQGEISGQAMIPLVGATTGSYDLDIRKFDLRRMVEILMDDPIQADGQVDTRLSGRIGKTITGSGTMSLRRAGLFGVRDQSMRLPVRFDLDPLRQRASVEIPRNRFKLFRGNVNGYAKLDIGSRVRLDSKFDLANIDAYSMIHSLTGFTGSGNGKLSGHLEVSGKSIRSENDLVGLFQGKLQQSNAFSFPLLDQIGRVLGSASSWRNKRFESENIDLTLNKGRVEVREFRLQNSLASVAVEGNAWLNGQLDMEVAARIDSLDQPSLVQQLAGSPLAKLTGSQAAFFAQASDFLSERIVFVDIGGTVQRPQMRLNPGKQLKEEAIRYFLRGSQILPNANGRNN